MKTSDSSIFFTSKTPLEQNTKQKLQFIIDYFNGKIHHIHIFKGDRHLIDDQTSKASWNIHIQSKENVEESKDIYLTGTLKKAEVESIAFDILANPLIEKIEINPLSTQMPPQLEYQKIELNQEEMEAIRIYHSQSAVQKERSSLGIGAHLTDTELQIFAHMWSEKCKRKIFNAKIRYKEHPKVIDIDSLFHSYIVRVAQDLRRERPWLRSVFTDSAGILSFGEDETLSFNVETGSPSISKYSEGVTGVLRVMRSLMGTGRGNHIIAATSVVDTSDIKDIKNIHLGAADGSFATSVPLISNSFYLNESSSPLEPSVAYFGAVGCSKLKINGERTDIKEVYPDDLIVIAGGRTGRGGLDNPFAQKKLHDFLLEAKNLYRTLKEIDTGGILRSLCTLAHLTGGCKLYLEKVLLKTENMAPWEILTAESEGRMLLVVPPENIEALLQLATDHVIEITSIGLFNHSGFLQATHQDAWVANLNLQFIHEGMPQLVLDAEWHYPPKIHMATPDMPTREELIEFLAHPNARNRQETVAIAKTGKESVVLSNSLHKELCNIDPFIMAANTVDEAVKNAVAIGCDPETIAIAANFCWPDPIFDPVHNPDGKLKLGALVRACHGLNFSARELKTPIISQKETIQHKKTAPSLLISAIGKIPDSKKQISIEFKHPGELIYLIGLTENMMAGTAYATFKGIDGGAFPNTKPKEALSLYQLLHSALMEGWITACHGLGSGGLFLSLVKMATVKNLGCTIDLEKMRTKGFLNFTEKLFSASPSRFLVTIKKEHSSAFEMLFKNLSISLLGRVEKNPILNFGFTSIKVQD